MAGHRDDARPGKLLPDRDGPKCLCRVIVPSRLMRRICILTLENKTLEHDATGRTHAKAAGGDMT